MRRSRGTSLLVWGLGLALAVGVFVIGGRLSEATDFLRLLQHARPAWLLAAVLLQAGTYLCQAEVFWDVGRSSGAALSRLELYRLSLAKQFVDQALPSVGLSGAVLISRALIRQGLTGPAAWAAVAVNLISYNVAYIVGLAAALSLRMLHGRGSAFVIWLSMLFVLSTVGLTVAMWMLPGRRHHRIGRRIARIPIVRGVLEPLESANSRLVRRPLLVTAASAWQAAIIVLDVLTLAALVESVGTQPRAGVFVSFMISSLVRSMGFIPGGLGTFEATSVLTLRMTGATLSVALAATLLFRGLSFWLPMLPGLWYSRRVV